MRQEPNLFTIDMRVQCPKDGHLDPTALDFSALLPDVMTIADEVDAQLTQNNG